MITQKQQAITIIALSNLARKASGHVQPTLKEAETFRDALITVMGAARILTDEEMISLAAGAVKEIMAMPISDVKITPETEATLQ
jgi:hypothetical protein